MTTTARSSKRKEKWDRPVSKKFYDHIISQIRTAASLSDDINADNVIRCLEEYLTHRTATADFTETETVVFTLLQPLIDQAMRRSDRARQVAARRRASRQSTEGNTIQPPSEAPESDTQSTALPQITRESKRALRRQATLQHRQQKHLKRLHRRYPQKDKDETMPCPLHKCT
jgi:hypothetical protein